MMVATTAKRRPAKASRKPKDADDSALARRARAGLNIERERMLRVERETLERQRVPIDVVRPWLRNLTGTIQRALSRIGGLPGVTPEQAAWLAEFDRTVRAEIQAAG